MPKTSAKDGLGDRVRAQLDKRDSTIPKLAKRLKMPKSTLYAMLEREGWPKQEPVFYAQLAKALQCNVADLLPDDVARELGVADPPAVNEAPRKEQAMERRFPYPDEQPAKKFASPITPESIALHSIGRIEHYLARLLEFEELHTLRIKELTRDFRKEIEDTRHNLLRVIEHDDKGRKL